MHVTVVVHILIKSEICALSRSYKDIQARKNAHDLAAKKIDSQEKVTPSSAILDQVCDKYC